MHLTRINYSSWPAHLGEFIVNFLIAAIFRVFLQGVFLKTVLHIISSIHLINTYVHASTINALWSFKCHSNTQRLDSCQEPIKKRNINIYLQTCQDNLTVCLHGRCIVVGLNDRLSSGQTFEV